MKVLFSMAAMMFVLHGFGQSTAEVQVLKLSADIFKWETENKNDLLDKIFDEKFMVVNAKGESQTKEQYMTLLKGGKFVHDSIDIEQNTAMVTNNTGTVFGKGKFVVTSSGNKITMHLSYMEVFTRPDDKGSWKIVAMHAGTLQNQQ